MRAREDLKRREEENKMERKQEIEHRRRGGREEMRCLA
jgi:hypothetical protein